MANQEEDQDLIALFRAHNQQPAEMVPFLETAQSCCQELTSSIIQPENYGLDSERVSDLLELVLSQSGLQNKILEAVDAPPAAPDQFLDQVESNLMPTLLASIADVIGGDMPQGLNSNLMMQLLRNNFGAISADNADPALFMNGIMSQVDSIGPDLNRG